MPKTLREQLKERNEQIEHFQSLAKPWGDRTTPQSDFDKTTGVFLLAGRNRGDVKVTLQGNKTRKVRTGRNVVVAHGRGEVLVLPASGKDVIDFQHTRVTIDQLRKPANDDGVVREIRHAARKVLPSAPRLPRLPRGK